MLVRNHKSLLRFGSVILSVTLKTVMHVLTQLELRETVFSSRPHLGHRGRCSGSAVCISPTQRAELDTSVWLTLNQHVQ